MDTNVSATSFCFFARSNQARLGLFLTLATDSQWPFLLSFLVSTLKSIYVAELHKLLCNSVTESFHAPFPTCLGYHMLVALGG